MHFGTTLGAVRSTQSCSQASPFCFEEPSLAALQNWMQHGCSRGSPFVMCAYTSSPQTAVLCSSSPPSPSSAEVFGDPLDASGDKAESSETVSNACSPVCTCLISMTASEASPTTAQPASSSSMIACCLAGDRSS